METIKSILWTWLEGALTLTGIVVWLSLFEPHFSLSYIAASLCFFIPIWIIEVTIWQDIVNRGK